MLERYQAMQMIWSWWCFGSSTVPLMAALHTSLWLESGLHRISRFWSDLNDANPPFLSMTWIESLYCFDDPRICCSRVFPGDDKWNFWHLLLLLLWWSSLLSRLQGRWSEILWLKSSITLRGGSILDIACMVLMRVFGPAQSVDLFVIDVIFWTTLLVSWLMNWLFDPLVNSRLN